MKKLLTLLAGAALAAFAAACDTTTTTNTTTENRTTTVNTNTNANANGNANLTANANANVPSRRAYNANISEEEYNKEKERYGEEAKQGGETIGQGLKDGWLWVKVKGALAAVDDLRDSTINVDVNNAVATLRGSVANAAQKTKAEQTAKGVSGVKSVTNQLTVKADEGLLGGNANANRAANTNNTNTKAGNHNK